ncbi:MAG: NifB/NifX family molybdenum-iron cluster-binding protein [Kineosporiaceae bacterium]
MLGDEHTDDAIARLLASRSPAKDRPYVAVCTQEGFLVNQHLGGADRVLVYADSGSLTAAGEPIGQLVETRLTPEAGGGARRWSSLAALVSDCRALLCHQLGPTPRLVLERSGLTVYETDGLIGDAVTDVFAGRTPRQALAPRDCASGSCDGPGTGCG